MRAPEADRHLHGTHPQAGQMTRTHVGSRDGCRGVVWRPYTETLTLDGMQTQVVGCSAG